MKFPWSKTLWQHKQELAKPGRYYGNGGTIHNTGYVDVETDALGHVVAVWFRCQPLPFVQANVSQQRAEEMFAMYTAAPGLTISGVEIVDL